MARNPNRFEGVDTIKGPEIHMKLTNDDIDVNKSRMKAQQANKSNLTNLQNLMNQTPNDNVEQIYMKGRGRADSNDLLISDIMELRQMEIETQEHEVDKKFVLNDPVIDDLLVSQLYSIGSLKERLEVALDTLDAKMKTIEQN